MGQLHACKIYVIDLAEYHSFSIGAISMQTSPIQSYPAVTKIWQSFITHAFHCEVISYYIKMSILHTVPQYLFHCVCQHFFSGHVVCLKALITLNTLMSGCFQGFSEKNA